MTIFAAIRLAVINLRIRASRSLLTVLGIAIAVTTLIVLLSIGRAVESVVVSEFRALGNNMILVFPGESSFFQRDNRLVGASALSREDADAIIRSPLAADVGLIVPTTENPAVVSRLATETETTVTGTTTDFPEIRNFRPVVGRFFTPNEVTRAARVAVIGQTVYTQLFPENEFPIGETIRIKNVSFRIIGILSEKGGATFQNQDNIVVIPVTTARQRLFPARLANGETQIDMIMIQSLTEGRQDIAIDQVREVLRQQHNLAFDIADDFTITTQVELVATSQRVVQIMTVLLLVIAGVAMLVGGIGVANIMLMNVTERTREIGLRMAVGARRGDIQMQFLVESMTISVIGGVIGYLLSVIVLLFIQRFTTFIVPIIPVQIVVIALITTLVVGVVAGFYPALQAARSSPVESLKYE